MSTATATTTTTIQGEPSKPQNKKLQECKTCNAAGFPNQLIGFEKVGPLGMVKSINTKTIKVRRNLFLSIDEL
jgi:hypothetical protein